jgi:hypothetical protein
MFMYIDYEFIRSMRAAMQASNNFYVHKNELKSPGKIIPLFNLNPNYLFHRRIAPAFWTGRNFRKQK